MERIVKGGFPRIMVKIHKLDVKQEQGFSQYSIKNMMKVKKSNPLKTEHSGLRETGRYSNEIQGVPIDVFAK